ncbi:MAG: D-glycero-beta-D-manno-heptose 1-phosphate adenylyltransferase [Calditrichaeota bacterium]|nr:D-glycero-beta-D-manno-heptose 1-phosphate adenylyltransferase [Calditrichota bacterium]
MTLTSEQTRELLRKIEKLRVLVVGDVVLEETITGRMVGVAKEGPTPVVDVTGSVSEVGAAGFAARLAAQYAGSVALATAVGKDAAGEQILEILRADGVDVSSVVADDTVATPTRTHVVAEAEHNPRQEVLRLRRVDRAGLTGGALSSLLSKLEKKLDQVDVVLFVDQDLGVASEQVVALLARAAQEGKVVVVGDSQTRASQLRGFSAVVVNDDEASRATGIRPTDEATAVQAAERLREQTGAGSVLLTRGARSAVLVTEKGSEAVAVEPQRVYDVTGAGETVSVLFGLALAAGEPAENAAELATKVASLAVSYPGLAVVPRAELVRYLDRAQARLQAEKIVERDRLREIVVQAKRRGQRVVWTNGCFDLLHVGHILYLEKARSLGDLLVVGLNSDASVRATKGPTRPIVQEAQRAKLLASLSCVDYVVIFDEESPKQLIAELQPDVYVKGGDYTLDTINQEERRIVEGYGGEIALLPGAEGMSTTNLIEKILKVHKREESGKQ